MKLINHSFSNFNGCTVEVREWTSNFNHTGHVMTYPCLDLRLIHVSKRGKLWVLSWCDITYPRHNVYLPIPRCKYMCIHSRHHYRSPSSDTGCWHTRQYLGTNFMGVSSNIVIVDIVNILQELYTVVVRCGMVPEMFAHIIHGYIISTEVTHLAKSLS